MEIQSRGMMSVLVRKISKDEKCASLDNLNKSVALEIALTQISESEILYLFNSTFFNTTSILNNKSKWSINKNDIKLTNTKPKKYSKLLN